MEGEDMYDDMYYQEYDQMDPLQAQMIQELQGMDPKQRAEHILKLRALAAAEYG